MIFDRREQGRVVSQRILIVEVFVTEREGVNSLGQKISLLSTYKMPTNMESTRTESLFIVQTFLRLEDANEDDKKQINLIKEACATHLHHLGAVPTNSNGKSLVFPFSTVTVNPEVSFLE